MSKQSLNEQQFIDQAFAAINSGDSAKISGLMDTDATDLATKAVPASEDEDGPAVTDPQLEQPVVVPETKPEGEETPKGSEEVKSSAEDDKSKETKEEWLSKLPEDLRKDVEAKFNALNADNSVLQHYYKSNEGRTSALQKKINSLERELENRNKAPANQPPPASVPARAAAQSADLDLEDDEVLAQLKEDDPATYRLLKQRDQKILSEAQKLVEKAKAEFTSTLENKFAPIYQSQEDALIEQEQRKVLSVVTNADKVVATKEWKIFEETSPPGVRNLINSHAAEDVILAFKIYADWLEGSGLVPSSYKEQGIEEVKPPVNPQNKGTTDSAQVDKVIDARQRKLQSGAVASASATVPSHQTELDHAKLLEKMFQEISEREGYNRKFTNQQKK